jgi:hypothetical protein
VMAMALAMLVPVLVLVLLTLKVQIAILARPRLTWRLLSLLLMRLATMAMAVATAVAMAKATAMATAVAMATAAKAMAMAMAKGDGRRRSGDGVPAAFRLLLKMPVQIVVHWRYCAMVRNIETLNGGACCCVHTIASALRLSVLSSSFSPSSVHSLQKLHIIIIIKPAARLSASIEADLAKHKRTLRIWTPPPIAIIHHMHASFSSSLHISVSAPCFREDDLAARRHSEAPRKFAQSTHARSRRGHIH